MPKKRVTYNEKRKLLRRIQRFYDTDPEFKAHVDAIVAHDLDVMRTKVLTESPLIMLTAIRHQPDPEEDEE